ncbi:RNA polymerase sigma factor [Paenibacillus apiarius]|uniref:RNA polymerase sigma factor n=1 Tax=Paenibacillus apiarius TaxID=46240 RepID=A0ABT4DP34_9BACL|nr:RNA polymerase sigma factor [Paenibacillus apiarius]MBN3524893.1 RNA polymerase sigma factor [Paenibacillus apiarius]MCY9515240.1 RNA polymerase sigma factor [Paenibacillus apiarius]MCY9519117.1 RNA polymerase sigma factor [Paenibacillus apiarius]MCY9550301.1 RNA polymerase sigma factor [Paenibacillus apiarius]MCY9561155.1 RNA polymerase sigma factor [Paenibacillus apiarius]
MTDREFFERYNKEVYRTCYYMLRDASDAEDICQEVFMKALTSGWQQVEYLKTWLMRITVNHCLNHLRRRKTRRMKEKMLLLFQREQAEPSALSMVERQETEDEWKRRMAQLPDKIRAVVTLRYTNDFALAEIAEILEIPIGTVKSRLNRGLKLMKVMLNELDDSERPVDNTVMNQTIRGKEGAEYEQGDTRGESPCSATGR